MGTTTFRLLKLFLAMSVTLAAPACLAASAPPQLYNKSIYVTYQQYAVERGPSGREISARVDVRATVRARQCVRCREEFI